MGLTEDLKKLWQTVFHDSDDVINAFFDTVCSEELTAAEYIDGKPAAAAYVLPFGELVGSGGEREKCAHIYAVGVAPEYRGRGLGISVTNKAVDIANKAGFQCIVLHPASKELFDFYREHCGFYTAFTGVIQTFELSGNGGAERISPEKYRDIREKLLSGISHIDIHENVLELFCRLGGGLYCLEGGCCAAEEIGDTAFFRELICNDNLVSAECLSETTKLKKASVTMPDREKNGKPIGMLYGNTKKEKMWMGITME